MLEAVPNVSEGRDPEVIRRLAEATEPLLADLHSDPAHHRSVLTLFGSADELHDAVRRLFEAARETIDLRRHRGEHPRIGALDVVPFVPVAGARMEDAARLARRTAAALGESGAPVFLYGRKRPLRDLRRGGPAGLGRRLAEGTLVPDFGPARLHPTAGAVAVGARRPLVAFNVNLDGDDAVPARRIARAVRETGGGLPGVRALGVRVRGGAQVTMNVERVEATALGAVFARVAEEARRRGVRILGSELVGLVPEAATWPGMRRDLGLSAAPRTIEAALEG